MQTTTITPSVGLSVVSNAKPNDELAWPGIIDHTGENEIAQGSRTLKHYSNKKKNSIINYI